METLTYDNLLEIFLKLDSKEILQLCQVEKRFDQFCKRNDLWKRLFQRDYAVYMAYPPIQLDDTNWKENYHAIFKHKTYRNKDFRGLYGRNKDFRGLYGFLHKIDPEVNVTINLDEKSRISFRFPKVYPIAIEKKITEYIEDNYPSFIRTGQRNWRELDVISIGMFAYDSGQKTSIRRHVKL